MPPRAPAPELSGRYRDLVADTNILLLLLAFEHLERAGASAAARFRILSDVRSRGEDIQLDHYRAVWALFQSAGRRIVTQHVIAEIKIDKLAQKLHTDVGPLLETTVGLLERTQTIEMPCSVVELYQDHSYRAVIQNIGLTDAGLISIAERERCALLSDDQDLARWARIRSVRCLSLEHIVEI